MFAPTKRRQISYYLSLPFVVAFVFFLAAKLAALQRAEMVAELADQVAHQDTPDATAALRQLAAMPRPPLEVLVEAATSADPEIADEAQHLISGLLRRWQRQIEAERGVATVSRQLAALSESLDAKHTGFSRADHRWLTTTARKILRLANRISPSKSPLVAMHCDTVLAAVSASDATVAALINRDLLADRQPVVTEAVAPVETQSPMTSNQAVLQREFSASAARPLASSTEPVHDQLGKPVVRELSPRTTQVNLPQPNSEENHTTRTPAWSYPTLNASPAMPINSLPVGRGQPARTGKMPTTKRANAKLAPRPLADTDARELLHRWLEADGSAVLPLEDELTHRGFGRLSARLVEQLYSDEVQDRLRLVDDVLIEPGIDARPWLMLLADDKDADVRLLAVTIMATSDDRALIEKAWQVAIRDRDPRIAGLADRLRDRRDSAQRR